MLRWNRIITVAATQVTVPPLDSRSTNGTEYSTVVPVCARVAATRDGRTSVSTSRHRNRLSGRGTSGALPSIVATTKGKWWLSFDVAAPHHKASMMSFAASTMSTNGRKNTRRVTQ